LAAWWVEQEERMGSTFRADRPPYRQLMALDAAQGSLFADRDFADCICHEGTEEEAA
jgi:hypothetical protein